MKVKFKYEDMIKKIKGTKKLKNFKKIIKDIPKIPGCPTGEELEKLSKKIKHDIGTKMDEIINGKDSTKKEKEGLAKPKKDDAKKKKGNEGKKGKKGKKGKGKKGKDKGEKGKDKGKSYIDKKMKKKKEYLDSIPKKIEKKIEKCKTFNNFLEEYPAMKDGWVEPTENNKGICQEEKEKVKKEKTKKKNGTGTGTGTATGTGTGTGTGTATGTATGTGTGTGTNQTNNVSSPTNTTEKVEDIKKKLRKAELSLIKIYSMLKESITVILFKDYDYINQSKTVIENFGLEYIKTKQSEYLRVFYNKLKELLDDHIRYNSTDNMFFFDVSNVSDKTIWGDVDYTGCQKKSNVQSNPQVSTEAATGGSINTSETPKFVINEDENSITVKSLLGVVCGPPDDLKDNLLLNLTKEYNKILRYINCIELLFILFLDTDIKPLVDRNDNEIKISTNFDFNIDNSKGLVFLKCYYGEPSSIFNFFKQEFDKLDEPIINPPNVPLFKYPIFMTYLYQIIHVLIDLEKDGKQLIFGGFLDKFLGFIFYFNESVNSSFKCKFIPYLNKCKISINDENNETKFLQYYKLNWLTRIYNDLKNIRAKNTSNVKIQHVSKLIMEPSILGINIVSNWSKKLPTYKANIGNLEYCYNNKEDEKCTICK